MGLLNYNILLLIAIFIILYLSFDNIEPFVNDIDYDDLVYIPTRDNNSNGMLNNYHMKKNFQNTKNLTRGFLSDVYDYMGLDSHHYLFESPHTNTKKYECTINVAIHLILIDR